MEVNEVANPTELARLSGVPQSVLSRFISGVHGSINLDALEKISKALDIEPAQLLERNPRSAPDARTAHVLQAMEVLPDWGKAVVEASATALVESAKGGKPGGTPPASP